MTASAAAARPRRRRPKPADPSLDGTPYIALIGDRVSKCWFPILHGDMDRPGEPSRPLSLDEYKRYGRQMIMPEWGLQGQLKLKAARVAVVGAGGLGCPALQYLAGAGVGTIGIFDHDTVSISNLHRQVLHTTDRVGMSKAESAEIALQGLNPHVKVVPQVEALTPFNALSLLRGYDLVLDCTDRPLTRYLVNDAAVRLSIPLVSGAAISSVGQWATYIRSSATPGKGKQRACYRCQWPEVLGDSGRCDETGVWGPATGIVGTAMASEAIRVILGLESDRDGMLHMLNLGGAPMTRSIKLRPPRPKCIACGPDATLTDDLTTMDYDEFCAGPKPPDGTETDRQVQRISVTELATTLGSSASSRVIIDTRPPVEYEICSVPGTINVPFRDIVRAPEQLPPAQQVIFVCRRGNDSLVAAQAAQAALPDTVKVADVVGGLEAWSRVVDPSFPIY